MNWLIENWSIVWLYTIATIFVLSMVIVVGRVLYHDWLMQREIRMRQLQPITPPIRSLSIDELLQSLDVLINLEFVAVVEAPMMTQDLKVINDFEKYQSEITHSVISSLSTGFYLTANMTGVTSEYIRQYVARRVTYKLVDYMRVNNFTLQEE